MKGKVLRRRVWASDQRCLPNPIGSSLVKIYYPRNHSDNTTHTLITLGLANVNGPHHRTIRRRPRRRTRTTRQGLLKVLLWFVNRWKTNNRTLGSKWRVMFNLGPSTPQLTPCTQHILRPDNRPDDVHSFPPQLWRPTSVQ